MKITTHQRYDGSWAAVDEDTYDGAPDGNNQYGYGATEQEAIDDLKQLNDIYDCDKCEAPIGHNEESVEVSYGFICFKCAGH